MADASTVFTDLAVVGIHTLAMIAAMGALAPIVYAELGARILERTWFDVEHLQAS